MVPFLNSGCLSLYAVLMSFTCCIAGHAWDQWHRWPGWCVLSKVAYYHRLLEDIQRPLGGLSDNCHDQ